MRRLVGWARRRPPATEGGWTPVAAVAVRPAAGHSAASPGGVAMALGRVEVREMASSASFGVGLGLCLMILVLFGRVWGPDYGGDLPSFMELYPIFTHPLAGLVVLAAHRARTRATHDGTQELFETCPTSQATRTLGHLLTGWFPALVTVIFLLLLTALISQSASLVYGEVGARQIASIVGAAGLLMGATALGIALARWAPWTVAPVAAVIAIGFGSTRLATAGDRVSEPLRQLSTWLNEPDGTLPFTAPHWMAHHAWMLSLVALVAVLALVRDQRRPRLLATGAAFAVVAIAAAVAAARPIDVTDAERIAALINDPGAHQRCVETSGLPICTVASNSRLADHLAAVVGPVAAAAPAGALEGWVVREGADLNRAQLDPEVVRLLRADGVESERVIPMEIQVHPQADQGARFWVALTAVGVTDGVVEHSVLSLDHQARGVVALWLATRGLDAGTAAEMTSFDDGPQASHASYTRPWPDTCWAGPTPVTWALTDLDAARALLAMPEKAVAELLRSDWARFTDRTTSTDELMTAAGLAPVAPRSGVTRSSDEC